MLRKCAAALGIVAFVCASAAPARPDAKAEALLQEVAAKYQGLQSLTATVVTATRFYRTASPIEIRATFKLARPNLALFDQTAPAGSSVRAFSRVSDGKTVYELNKFDGTVATREAAPGGENILAFSTAMGAFFNPKLLAPHAGWVSRFAGRAPVDDVLCQVVEWKQDGLDIHEGRTFYIGPDRLIHRFVDDRGSWIEDSVFRDLRVNVPLAADQFKAPQAPRPAP